MCTVYAACAVYGMHVLTVRVGATVCTQAATLCAQVRLGVAYAILTECKGELPWGIAGGPYKQSNATVACLRTSHMGFQYVAEVWDAWQTKAFAGSKQEATAYAAASRRLSRCSELMLHPPGGIGPSAKYAANLRVWKATVPAAQLKVVITEDLERSPDRVVKEVLDFLGLDYSLLPAGPTHDCVVGKAGIMDETVAWVPDAGKKDSGGKEIVINKAGAFGKGRGLGVAGTGRDAATKNIAIGDCTSDGLKQVDAGSKVKKYKMDPVTERTLQRFFEPYNKQLVAVLGYDPGWDALESAPGAA